MLADKLFHVNVVRRYVRMHKCVAKTRSILAVLLTFSIRYGLVFWNGKQKSLPTYAAAMVTSLFCNSLVLHFLTRSGGKEKNTLCSIDRSIDRSMRIRRKTMTFCAYWVVSCSIQHFLISSSLVIHKSISSFSLSLSNCFSSPLALKSRLTRFISPSISVSHIRLTDRQTDLLVSDIISEKLS